MQVIKWLVKTAGILLVTFAVLAATWFTKPWDDLQSWRFFLTQPVVGWRADIFTNWELIQPVAELRASTKPRVYKRDLNSPDTVSYSLDGKSIPLSDYLDRANISGLMVLHDGVIKMEYYAHGLNAESRCHLWSASKSFTSTLVAMGVHDGKIKSLDDKVEKYAPQFAGTAYGETPIRHVLMMSSGIDFFHDKGTPNRVDMYWDIMHDRQDFDKWVAKLPRRVPSGTDFNYIATDTHVLAAVLRGAYGQPFPEIVQDRLWERGGFAGDASWGLDGVGHAMGHLSLSVRLEEFANLGQLYVEDLKLNGEQSVPDDWFSIVENPQGDFQEPSFDEAGNQREGYSVQFWIPLDYDQQFMAAGAFGQYLWIDRRQGTVVAQFSVGEPVLFADEDDHITPKEFAAVMRVLANKETFR
jgi:CubicO group peptidase (beta-lactamase class C family)